MKLIPNSNRIVVEPIEVADVTPGGIHLPDNAKEKPLRGTVVAVGSGRRTDQGVLLRVNVDVGDQVIYGQYAGTRIEHEGTEYLVMTDDEVLCVVAED